MKLFDNISGLSIIGGGMAKLGPNKKAIEKARAEGDVKTEQAEILKAPWLAGIQPGEIYTVPISHGEGRFMASQALLTELAANGQIITQYADFDGNATMEMQHNPNGSDWAVEGIISPDGRVLGKMGHSERIGSGLYQNVPGRFDMQMFTSAVQYFK